jgi:glycosyltransferase involved in cell wall biosynthesis
VGVSDWLGKLYNTDYLPHIVSMPDITTSQREYFNFSDEDIVFGRYGGFYQFDVPYLGEVILAAAERGIKFLLMNTVRVTPDHPNIIYLDSTTDVEAKTKFINTCDAMLHGRTDGESFGLSIAEFLHQNKPVISNLHCRDKNHINLLGEKGFFYSNPGELFNLLINFKKGDYSVKSLVDQFSPEKIMTKFKELIEK